MRTAGRIPGRVAPRSGCTGRGCRSGGCLGGGILGPALLALALHLWAGSATAFAPDASPRPPARPATEAEVARTEPDVLRPRMSPTDAVAAASLVPLPRAAAPSPPGAATRGGVTDPPEAAAVAGAAPAPPPPRPSPTAIGGRAPSLVFPEVAAASLAAPRPLRPPARPQDPAAAPARPASLAVALSPRPEARPEARPQAPARGGPGGARGSLQEPGAAPGARPSPGGVSLASAFRTRPQSDLARPAPGGRLCGVRGIEGETVAPIVSRAHGCGIAEPVRVTAVEGVRLSTGALMDCPTALALRTWVRDGVLPVVGARGGGAASLTVAAHYTCRTRNNRPGARISEHGRGRAIDISSIVLNDGTPITVLNGWGDAQQGPILRALHRAACGPFGTVLGPASDRFHRDHFHFDTARYRSGAFCR